ncbi:LSM domain superfamily [Arabidopsis thaliana x Arabidopsis arenosa]|uniref:LSM domain superfamily n=1 Tax=Arabidopsis thaliana x Arabidopsis arenosa TaxID=1240361 RepID=A0A8T2E2V4_9BRAS|nr:LSM domain superfamily [Arabidopsis thaliana x Arabidopsis arenosa]
MERETSSSSTPPEDLVTSMIGKFVAVMSNNDIRYEGVISLLNLQDSKLGLQNVVRVYGREVENDNEQRVFQVLKEVHSHMVFRGSDIKSVEVLSLPPPARHTSAIGHVGMCYGTEGRTKRRRSIVACNQLAGSIHFKFRDIKALEIIFVRELLHNDDREFADQFPPLSRSHICHRQGGV